MRPPNLTVIAAILALATLSPALAATISYWEFDNGGLSDSVGTYDLVPTGGSLSLSASAVEAVPVVPNPDGSLSFVGDPAANPDSGSTGSLYWNHGNGTGRVAVTSDPGNVFNLSGKSFTFEGWFQHDTFQSSTDVSPSTDFGDVIGGTRNSNTGPTNFGGYLLTMRGGATDGRLSALFSEGNGGESFALFTPPGTNYLGSSASDFYHFALIWQDGLGDNLTGLAELYVDGVLQDSDSAPVGFDASLADGFADDFMLGGRNFNGHTWAGRFDEFRFSDEALEPWQFLNGSGSAPVPEPGTWLLMAMSLPLGFWLHRRRQTA